VPLRLRFLPTSLVAVALLLAGCGRQGLHPTSAVSPAQGLPSSLPILPLADRVTPAGGWASFFPLKVGNQWHYDRTLSVRITQDDGTLVDESELNIAKDARIVGTETIGGRTYVVEEDVVHEEGGGGDVIRRVFWRQDRTGLYKADVPDLAASAAAKPAPGAETAALDRAWSRLEGRLARPGFREAFGAARERLAQKMEIVERVLPAPARSPSESAPPAELTRLSYPLHVGAQWTVREEPLLTARVEGLDVLTLPAGRFSGWRIRYFSERFGPGDEVRVWYGRDGYLAREARLEGEALDAQGNPIGTTIASITEQLGEHAAASTSQDLRLTGSMTELSTLVQGDCFYGDANEPWIFFDNSDFTLSELHARGDGDERGDATWWINWPITPYTNGELIQSVTVQIRAKAQSSAWSAPAEASIRPCIDLAGYGAPKFFTADTDYQWSTWTFTTDPRDGRPWEIANLNSARFGFETHGSSQTPFTTAVTKVFFSEYRIWVTRVDRR
jgi:hypothetical protein